MDTQELTSSPCDVIRAVALAARGLLRAGDVPGLEVAPPQVSWLWKLRFLSLVATSTLRLRHALCEAREHPAAILLARPAAGTRTHAAAHARPLGTRKCERSHVGGAGAQVAWGSLSR